MQNIIIEEEGNLFVANPVKNYVVRFNDFF